MSLAKLNDRNGNIFLRSFKVSLLCRFIFVLIWHVWALISQPVFLFSLMCLLTKCSRTVCGPFFLFVWIGDVLKWPSHPPHAEVFNPRKDSHTRRIQFFFGQKRGGVYLIEVFYFSSRFRCTQWGNSLFLFRWKTNWLVFPRGKRAPERRRQFELRHFAWSGQTHSETTRFFWFFFILWEEGSCCERLHPVPIFIYF